MDEVLAERYPPLGRGDLARDRTPAPPPRTSSQAEQARHRRDLLAALTHRPAGGVAR